MSDSDSDDLNDRPKVVYAQRHRHVPYVEPIKHTISYDFNVKPSIVLLRKSFPFLLTMAESYQIEETRFFETDLKYDDIMPLLRARCSAFTNAFGTNRTEDFVHSTYGYTSNVQSVTDPISRICLDIKIVRNYPPGQRIVEGVLTATGHVLTRSCRGLATSLDLPMHLHRLLHDNIYKMYHLRYDDVPLGEYAEEAILRIINEKPINRLGDYVKMCALILQLIYTYELRFQTPEFAMRLQNVFKTLAEKLDGP